MKKTKNIFLGKKILIYGLGKSGISSYKFLKDKALVYLFDDNFKTNLKIRKKFINKGIKEYIKLIKLSLFFSIKYFKKKIGLSTQA